LLGIARICERASPPVDKGIRIAATNIYNALYKVDKGLVVGEYQVVENLTSSDCLSGLMVYVQNMAVVWVVMSNKAILSIRLGP
jgi:hypothetical protein